MWQKFRSFAASYLAALATCPIDIPESGRISSGTARATEAAVFDIKRIIRRFGETLREMGLLMMVFVRSTHCSPSAMSVRS